MWGCRSRVALWFLGAKKGHGWDDGVTHGNTVTKRHPRLFEMICLFEVKKCTRTNISRDDYSYHVVAKQVFVVNIFCRQVFDHVNPQSLPLKFPRSLQTLQVVFKGIPRVCSFQKAAGVSTKLETLVWVADFRLKDHLLRGCPQWI